ncbi:MAG TPA: acyl-CoA dehydrogenase family protein [Candidatus Angelobacter sp.]|jgi:alkylation response protein AidB-like acyl-CoA dehydrogenase|nr:acyl-CoA dehydrogenase family protein [Candidatus Angelobacter sp.]
MHFAFDAQQRSFAESVRTLLTRECTPAMLRAEFDGAPRSTQRWQKLADAGLCGVLLDGLSEVDAVLALEETGRFALPDPIVESALVAAPLLAESGARVAVQLTRRGPYCVDADQAEVLLLQHGEALHRLDPAQVGMTAQPSLDAGRRVFTVQWTPSAASLLTGDAAVLALAFDRGAFGASAQLLGLAARMIDMAAEHARSREQFGRPIGSFQAVKHLLADALLALEFARPVVYRAAWSLANHAPDRARDVSMAKAYASDAARTAGRAALQIHGAIGYTWAHDLHIWMKRAESLARDWGDAASHRDRVARSLLGALPGT